MELGNIKGSNSQTRLVYTIESVIATLATIHCINPECIEIVQPEGAKDRAFSGFENFAKGNLYPVAGLLAKIGGVDRTEAMLFLEQQREQLMKSIENEVRAKIARETANMLLGNVAEDRPKSDRKSEYLGLGIDAEAGERPTPNTGSPYTSSGEKTDGRRNPPYETEIRLDGWDSLKLVKNNPPSSNDIDRVNRLT